jgi:hypothetical protein
MELFAGNRRLSREMLSVGLSADDPVPSHAPLQAGDAELVRRAQLGSAAAFEELVVAFGPRVYRYLVLRLRDEASALDALQETLAAAWQGLPSLKQPGKFWPWLLDRGAKPVLAEARRERDSLRSAEVKFGQVAALRASRNRRIRCFYGAQRFSARKGPRVGAFPLSRMSQNLASGNKSAAQGAVMVAAGLLFARSAVIVIGPQRASAQS